MSIAIVTDLTDTAHVNSYVTVAELKVYAERKTNGLDIFNAADAEGGNRIPSALVEVADFMNHEDWHGNVVDEDQPMAWYRRGVLRTSNRAAYYAVDVLPDEVKRAQCELTLGYLDDEQILERIQSQGGLTRFTAGPLTLEFKNTEQRQVLRTYLRLTKDLINRNGRSSG